MTNRSQAAKSGREVLTDEAAKIFLPSRVGQGRQATTKERPLVFDDFWTDFAGRISCRHTFQSIVVGIADSANDLDSGCAPSPLELALTIAESASPDRFPGSAGQQTSI